MPRPSEVTSGDVRRWQPRWEEWIEDEPPFRQTPLFREIFYAGEWLNEKLVALGMSEEERADVRFANDQKCCELPDPWEASAETLSECRAGRPPVPGPALAESLLRRTGRHLDLLGMLEQFVALGYPPEYVESVFDSHRMEPMRPPRPLPEGRHRYLFAELEEKGVTVHNTLVDQLMAIYRRLWRLRHDA